MSELTDIANKLKQMLVSTDEKWTNKDHEIVSSAISVIERADVSLNSASYKGFVKIEKQNYKQASRIVALEAAIEKFFESSLESDDYFSAVESLRAALNTTKPE
jgi:hypothetical protein